MQKILNLFSENSKISEIFINGIYGITWVLQDGSLEQRTTHEGLSAQSLTLEIQEFAFAQGVRLDTLHPFNGGTLKLGSSVFRWHAVLPPIASEGPIFSMRMHKFDSIGITDFQGSEATLNSIKALVEQGDSALICGTTASGKTTFLHALLKTYFAHKRMLIIEDIPEIPISNPKWTRLCSRPPSPQGTGEVTLSDLFRESLRLRPDHIVLGEIRQNCAELFLQISSSGHGGVYSTLHADSVSDVNRRLNGLRPQGMSCIFLERGEPPRVASIERL